MQFVLIPRFKCCGDCKSKYTLNLVRHLSSLCCPICLGELAAINPRLRLTEPIQDASEEPRRRFPYKYVDNGVKEQNNRIGKAFNQYTKAI